MKLATGLSYSAALAVAVGAPCHAFAPSPPSRTALATMAPMPRIRQSHRSVQRCDQTSLLNLFPSIVTADVVEAGINFGQVLCVGSISLGVVSHFTGLYPDYEKTVEDTVDEPDDTPVSILEKALQKTAPEPSKTGVFGFLRNKIKATPEEGVDEPPSETIEKPIQVMEAAAPADVDEAVNEPVAETIEELAQVVEDVVDTFYEDIVEPPLPLIVIPAASTAKPVSEQLKKETERAVAAVQEKGIKETMKKINTKSGGGEAKALVSTEDPGTKEKMAPSGDEGEGKTKKKMIRARTIVVAAVGVSIVRKLVQAYLGRGLL